ncbi:MAG: histidine kinase, partial [Conexibacter sp.]
MAGVLRRHTRPGASPRRAAAAIDRRGLAREVHDGLAQELAFIASQARRLDRSGTNATIVPQIQYAAQRALLEVRCTIESLRAPEDAPLELLLARVVTLFETRFGVDVELDLADRLDVGDEQRAALLRIVGQAITNAASHGGATHVLVQLARRDGGLVLRVDDDGCGFDG